MTNKTIKHKALLSKGELEISQEDIEYELEVLFKNNDIDLSNSTRKFKQVISFDVLSKTELYKICKKVLWAYNIEDSNKLMNYIYSDYIHYNNGFLNRQISEFITMLLVAFNEKNYPELHNKFPTDYDVKSSFYFMKHQDYSHLFRFWFFSSYIKSNEINGTYVTFINHITGESYRVELPNEKENKTK